MVSEPSRSTNGADGRDARGRFAAGNPGGPGNPHARRVARLRAELLRAVTPEDLAAIVGKLIELAKGGNVQAAREVLSRCLGPPVELDLLERLEALEANVGQSPRFPK